MPRIVGVVLAFKPEMPALVELHSALEKAGIEVYVVPTSRSAAESVEERNLPSLAIGSNPGFASAVSWAVSRLGNWDFLCLVNDDVHVGDASELRRLIASIMDSSQSLGLHFLDPARPRPVPGKLDVWAQVALIGPLLRKFNLRTSAQHLYGPFSFTIITSHLWDRLGGLDKTLPYTYEDADFTRRSYEVDADVQFHSPASVLHERSKTSRKHFDRVLPVATWSAREYLVKLGMSRLSATVATVSALCVRVPMSVLSSAPKRSHLKGIARSIWGLASARQPALAPYEDS